MIREVFLAASIGVLCLGGCVTTPHEDEDAIATQLAETVGSAYAIAYVEERVRDGELSRRDADELIAALEANEKTRVK